MLIVYKMIIFGRIRLIVWLNKDVSEMGLRFCCYVNIMFKFGDSFWLRVFIFLRGSNLDES